jgi:hypothetical protein
MRRLIIGSLLFLAACARDERPKVLAQCQFEASKRYEGDHAFAQHYEIASYVVMCMGAKGYEIGPGPNNPDPKAYFAQCPVVDGYKLNPNCYIRK